jgi:hypothetical protein
VGQSAADKDEVRRQRRSRRMVEEESNGPFERVLLTPEVSMDQLFKNLPTTLSADRLMEAHERE